MELFVTRQKDLTGIKIADGIFVVEEIEIKVSIQNHNNKLK